MSCSGRCSGCRAGRRRNKHGRQTDKTRASLLLENLSAPLGRHAGAGGDQRLYAAHHAGCGGRHGLSHPCGAAAGALSEAKTYADTKKSEAIDAAATDATTKANNALKSAKEFAQSLIEWGTL